LMPCFIFSVVFPIGVLLAMWVLPGAPRTPPVRNKHERGGGAHGPGGRVCL
jgi:hypothetical protein